MITKKFLFAVGIAAMTLSMNVVAKTDWSFATEERLESPKLVVDPPIGQEATKEIGDSLVRTGIRTMRITTFWNVKLKEETSGKFGLFAGYRRVSAIAGASGTLLYHSSNKSPMLCINSQGEGVSKVLISEISGCYVDTDKDGKFDSMAFPGHDTDGKLEKPIEYELIKKVQEVEEEGRDSYFVEVLYQGVSKGEVKISYREFKGGTARPAFTQDVSYELDPDGSGVIAFRGLRIKILKATRENITYVVQQIGSARV